MGLERFLEGRTIRYMVFGAILAILLPLGISLAQFASSQAREDRQAFLKLPADKEKKCVREVSYMRYHHMDLLKQVREEAVRFGRRGEITLDGCRECHSDREGFCNQCHNAVSLNVDCFGCHYYPESESVALEVGK